MAEERRCLVRIAQVKQETEDTVSFILKPQDAQIAARSGQFLTFLVKNNTGKEIRRSYSLSSSPELDEPLTVTIKRVPNGEISRWMVERVRERTVLETTGASGMFVLPEDPGKYEHFIFFAAGSGIVPVFSLIKTLLHKHAGVRVVLIYSNRNVANTIFYNNLTRLHEQFTERFTLKFLFSMSADVMRSRLTPTLLESFISTYEHQPASTLYYLCGPTSYMRMIQFYLLSLGIPPGHVRREQFFVPRMPVLPAPPDTAAHQVTLLSGDHHFIFSVQYPTTILKAARDLNIPVSFSCETGQCGTCVAKCLRGEVWMSRNEILLDEDLSKGNILTCTGYPVFGDVVIKI